MTHLYHSNTRMRPRERKSLEELRGITLKQGHEIEFCNKRYHIVRG